MDKDICFSSAQNLAKAIHERELSVREVMEAHIKQIKRVNSQVNAIVSLNEEVALKEAAKADEALEAGKPVGPFHGLPIAIKDTHNAIGFPATSGSLALRDHYPSEDDLIVERLRSAGAIVIGKTNVPEFAAGAHTFNEVFGATRNPYDLGKTAGGSSGGAAAAVTCGMIPFADGSDMGGSLRYPACFNNVVGLRTSPGRIPLPKAALYSPLGVQGPIARSVDDAFFMMSVISGPDNRSPLSIEEPGEKFLEPVQPDLKGLRIAYSTDFGGILPVEPEVRSNLEEQVKVFQDLGCQVEEACPDLHEAEEVFQVLRAWEFELSYSEIFNRFRELIKPSVIWNIEKGRNLSGPDIGRAERLRTLLYNRMRAFFTQYDALILPVTQVAAFDVNLEYPVQISGVKMENYIDWMRSCYYISAVGNPSLSIPSGFTSGGTPLGLQIVGPHRADFEVLKIGRAFEHATGYGKMRPEIALGEKIN
ncbi:amidase [Aeromicrobium ponti]|uniref:Amidase n=1 Tax=Cytobacillus oceanisediminis TaxID=665099 RepID=A0A562K327_9BACI|nr:amidase [Cytobacillus oceanisediminis]TWH89634.1 amidase [Cytobacillus oceanisediminis]